MALLVHSAERSCLAAGALFSQRKFIWRSPTQEDGEVQLPQAMLRPGPGYHGASSARRARSTCLDAKSPLWPVSYLLGSIRLNRTIAIWSFRYHSDCWSMGDRMTVIASLRNRTSRVGRVSRTGNRIRRYSARYSDGRPCARRGSAYGEVPIDQGRWGDVYSDLDSTALKMPW